MLCIPGIFLFFVFYNNIFNWLIDNKWKDNLETPELNSFSQIEIVKSLTKWYETWSEFLGYKIGYTGATRINNPEKIVKL
tara:strand:- start:55 stop:294 length:240 start_codon:yes stop_codon:yes gene_type:complete